MRVRLLRVESGFWVVLVSIVFDEISYCPVRLKGSFHGMQEVADMCGEFRQLEGVREGFVVVLGPPLR
ncbi:hypothetical protein R0G64_27170 [Pseudomonas otitidis]|uniref:Uncharacterized protein n=1 Tax=Metapseudomonas otitidis TaxID=319939 RepID=A0ABU3XYV7_9GAMM|nr:hypothetical protein [Pseudomonas otitidis]MDV3443100.1 hypothetical protein [Pseudomonas otitidis]